MKKIVLGFSAVAIALALGVSFVGAQTTTTTTSTTSTTASVFVRNLTIGSTGADVTALQAILIAKGKLMIAAPTGYFGALTKSALASWQASVGISPAVGYFGPITRAYLAANTTGSTTTTTSTVAGCTAGSMFSSTTGKPCTTSSSTTTTTTSGSLGGGETSLEDFDASSGDDSDVEEDGEGDVADFEFDVEDGDAQVDRIDVSFQGGTSEEDPWDTFDNVAIVVDGKVVADEDVDDEDAWSEDEDEIGSSADDYSIRFTNLDWIVDEGETAKFTVRVTAASGVDDLPSTWLVGIGDEGIRASDSEGIDNYIGEGTDTVSFDVEEAGQGEELSVSESDDEIEATTLRVENDETSEWYSILSFDIEAEDNDIQVKELPITLTLSNSKIATSVINDLELVIDGETYDDFSYGTSTAGSAVVVFDLDNDDVVVDADDSVSVELRAKFLAANDTNYSEGQTVTASISSTNVDLIDAEGADDLTASQLSGSVDGNAMTLRVEGISVTESSTDPKVIVTSADAADNGDYGTYTIKFNVTAFETDAWVPLSAGQFNNAASTTAGAVYFVTGTGASSTATTTGDLQVESGTTITSSRAKVPEGQTKEFTLTVVINAVTDGFYGVELQTTRFATTSSGALNAYTVPDENEFQVDNTFITAN